MKSFTPKSFILLLAAVMLTHVRAAEPLFPIAFFEEHSTESANRNGREFQMRRFEISGPAIEQKQPRVLISADGFRVDSSESHAGKAGFRVAFAGKRNHGQRVELLPESSIAITDFRAGTQTSSGRRRIWRAVRVRGLFDGIDLRYHADSGEFEFDVMVSPQADLSSVRFRVENIDHASIDRNGDLVLARGELTYRIRRPVAWQDGAKAREPVPVDFETRQGGNEFGFRAGNYDHSRPLIIDPLVSYSTFFTTPEAAVRMRDVLMDAAGNGFAIGEFPPNALLPWESTYGPATPSTGSTVFVARFENGSHSLSGLAVLGGNGATTVSRAVLDSAGNVCLAGSTTATNFPVSANAFQKTNAGGADAFLAVLHPSLGSLVYATYLGGALTDGAVGIAVSGSSAYLTGGTTSPDFPVSSGAFQGQLGGNQDSFATAVRLTDGGLQYSTYLGAAGKDFGSQIAVDAAGNAVVAGETYGIADPNFPITAGALDPSWNGYTDIFVAKLKPDGSQLSYSTYLGGARDDIPVALFLDAAGKATVIAKTTSLVEYDPELRFPLEPPVGISNYSMVTSATVFVRLNEEGSMIERSRALGRTETGAVPPTSFNDAILLEDSSILLSASGASSEPPLDGSTPRLFPGLQSTNTFVARLNRISFDIEWVRYSGQAGLPSRLAARTMSEVFTAGSVTSSAKRFVTTPDALQLEGLADTSGQPQAMLHVFDLESPIVCTYSFSPSEVTIPAEGASGTIQLQTQNECFWSLLADSDDAVTYPGETRGFGSAAIQYSFTPNNSTESRTRTLEFGGSLARLRQLPLSCDQAEFSPQAVALPGSASSASGTVSTNAGVRLPGGCEWSPVSETEWISVLKQQFGMQITATENNGAPRLGYVRVGTKKLPVSQQAKTGCSVSVLPQYEVSGVVTSLTVPFTTSESNCEWHAATSSPWIQVGGGGNGVGNGSLLLSLIANPTTVRREAVVAINGTTFRVAQSAGIAATIQVRSVPNYASLMSNKLNPVRIPVDLSVAVGDELVLTTLPYLTSSQFGFSPLAPVYRFAHWSVPGGSTQGETTLRFTPPQATTFELTANYVPLWRLALLSTESAGSITETVVRDANYTDYVQEGNLVTLEAKPRDGYVFVSFKNAFTGAREFANPWSFSMMENLTVAAEFQAAGSGDPPLLAAVVDAGGYRNVPLAPGMIVSAFGERLAGTTSNAETLPLPVLIGDTSVIVKDALGTSVFAPLFYVSPTQVNFAIPELSAPGPATVVIQRGSLLSTELPVAIQASSPSLFSANSDGKGAPAGYIQRVSRNGESTQLPVAFCSAMSPSCIPAPINVGEGDFDWFLILFGTGIRNGSTREVVIGGRSVTIDYAGPQGHFFGLDQVNVKLDRGLQGLGMAEVVFLVDGNEANRLTVSLP